jgi:hypothetical protein
VKLPTSKLAATCEDAWRTSARPHAGKDVSYCDNASAWITTSGERVFRLVYRTDDGQVVVEDVKKSE